jgi:hypothetical protein
MQGWFCQLMKTRAIGSRLQKEFQIRNINEFRKQENVLPGTGEVF